MTSRALTTEAADGQRFTLQTTTQGNVDVIVEEAGGSPGVTANVWLSLVGIPDLGVEGAQNNVVVAVRDAVAADFQLTANADWSLGDHGVLTWNGSSTITALVWAQSSPWVDTAGGGVGGTWGFAISVNGDLIGGPVLDGGEDLDAPLRVAGAGAFSFGNGNDYAAVSTLRRVTLAPGDTIQPVFGKAQNIAGDEGFLEALSLFVSY